jgi:hypothetical protein
VAVLLLTAGIGKANAFRRLLGPASFRRGGVSVLVVVAETACGIAMLLPGTQQEASMAAVALGVAFLAYGWRRGRRGEATASRRTVPNCGCLGDRLRPSPAMQGALPWIVLLGGIPGSASPSSEYASPVLAVAGGCLAVAALAALLATRHRSKHTR